VLAQQPVVQVVDAGQNAVATAGISITASLAGGTLSGTTVVNTNASGRATFTNLAIAGSTVGLIGINFSPEFRLVMDRSDDPPRENCSNRSLFVL